MYQLRKACYFEINNNKFIAPHGSNFIIKIEILFDQKIQILLNLMLNETKFFGPTFSRRLISERGEKWVLWMEYTWGILFFTEKNKIFDLKKNKLINKFKKVNYTDVSKEYLGLYRRFVEFNKVTYVDFQKNKFIYYLKLIKRSFLLLYRGFTT